MQPLEIIKEVEKYTKKYITLKDYPAILSQLIYQNNTKKFWEVCRYVNQNYDLKIPLGSKASGFVSLNSGNESFYINSLGLRIGLHKTGINKECLFFKNNYFHGMAFLNNITTMYINNDFFYKKNLRYL
jgi:hypothetical protein